MLLFLICLSLIAYPTVIIGKICPFLQQGTPKSGKANVPDLEKYNDELEKLDIMDVINDIRNILTKSQECWPMDEFKTGGSYGPLFIRLAWHCAGTFRLTDGKGGCGGGRQRFDPEASWDDNTNLDKARSLLVPIKKKYGDKLSWGDLMIFAGTAAIIDMGGPVTNICAGRIDSKDGTDSLVLGPSSSAHCPTPGNCPKPLGTSTIGLIYVNPEGFMGKPKPRETAEHIREIFERMGMNDTETVALVGGGHAFGKSHGACPLGAGLPPKDDPNNPWPGNCGTGKGKDTFTSGLEGQWTTNPIKWSNEFFKLLLNDAYKLEKSPAYKYQWRNQNKKKRNLIMLTTDLAFVNDKKYRKIVESFANNINTLNIAFANAWEKLVMSGGTWSKNKKCIKYNNFIDSVDDTYMDYMSNSYSDSYSDSHSHSKSKSNSNSHTMDSNNDESITMSYQ